MHPEARSSLTDTSEPMVGAPIKRSQKAAI